MRKRLKNLFSSPAIIREPGYEARSDPILASFPAFFSRGGGRASFARGGKKGPGIYCLRMCLILGKLHTSVYFRVTYYALLWVEHPVFVVNMAECTSSSSALADAIAYSNSLEKLGTTNICLKDEQQQAVKAIYDEQR